MTSAPLMFLTRYEIARALTVRASQLERNAAPTVDVSGDPTLEPLQIAYRELLSGSLPILIERDGDKHPVSRFNLPLDLSRNTEN